MSEVAVTEAEWDQAQKRLAAAVLELTEVASKLERTRTVLSETIQGIDRFTQEALHRFGELENRLAQLEARVAEGELAGPRMIGDHTR